jgi:hypothetical protein
LVKADSFADFFAALAAAPARLASAASFLILAGDCLATT